MNNTSPRWTTRVEHFMEAFILRSRWLLAPFYLGLILALIGLLVRFWMELLHLWPVVTGGSEGQTILGILNLIDLSLVANLVLIVIFSGYESFVSRIEAGDDQRPAWMGKVDFSGLKVKLMASLAAISGIYLLEALLNLHAQTWQALGWKLGIHFTFVLSGVLFAVMDRVAASAEAADHALPPARRDSSD